jgi:hypothetical protein
MAIRVQVGRHRSQKIHRPANTAMILPLAFLLGACGPAAVSLGTESNAETGVQCAAAGGTCVPAGDESCFGVKAPTSGQDCNPQLIPSGPFCCLPDVVDAGHVTCAPIACVAGAHWDPSSCTCIATDAGDAG